MCWWETWRQTAASVFPGIRSSLSPRTGNNRMQRREGQGCQSEWERVGVSFIHLLKISAQCKIWKQNSPNRGCPLIKLCLCYLSEHWIRLNGMKLAHGQHSVPCSLSETFELFIICFFYPKRSSGQTFCCSLWISRGHCRRPNCSLHKLIINSFNLTPSCSSCLRPPDSPVLQSNNLT